MKVLSSLAQEEEEGLLMYIVMAHERLVSESGSALVDILIARLHASWYSGGLQDSWLLRNRLHIIMGYGFRGYGSGIEAHPVTCPLITETKPSE